MRGLSGWYDPVCYQFYFYAHSNVKIEQSIINAYREFLDELMPCYALWLSMQGRILSKQWTENGCKMVSISTAEELGNYWDSILSDTARSMELSLVPGKALANFAVSSRSIAKIWKEQIMHFTNLRALDTVDKTAQKEWICRLMNCPTDDLRKLYFPKRCYMPNDMLLELSYESWSSLDTPAYLNEILKDIDTSAFHSGVFPPQYLHCVRVSVPRYMLDAMNQTFSLQYIWKKRQIILCEMFENSVGYMKMDACEMKHGSSLLSGSGSIIPGFSHYMPDIAWGMCLTKRQVQTLGGIEHLRNSHVFYDVEALSNQKCYLQLTPDISVVMKNEAAKLWNIMSPHLRIVPQDLHSIGEVPISFRLGIEDGKLHMDDYGNYYIS